MDKALYDKGMAMRRKVLGDEYVDRAVANTDDFNRKFQDLLNEFCWGAVWTDEDLKPRDRSLLNLGMIACLGRMHEFEAHFRGALRNGAHPQGTVGHAARRSPSIAASRPRSTATAWPSRCWRRKPRRPDRGESPVRSYPKFRPRLGRQVRREPAAIGAFGGRIIVLNVPSSRGIQTAQAAGSRPFRVA